MIGQNAASEPASDNTYTPKLRDGNLGANRTVRLDGESGQKAPLSGCFCGNCGRAENSLERDAES